MDVIHKIIAQLTAAAAQADTGVLMSVALAVFGLSTLGWWATRRKKADRT
jgi:hypothetical protein